MTGARFSKTDDVELKATEFVIRDRLLDSPEPTNPIEPKIAVPSWTGGNGDEGAITEYVIGVSSEVLLPKELDKAAM